MINSGTIYSNFTPIVKSPVIGYRVSGNDVLRILKKLTKRSFKKDHSIMRLVDLYRHDGEILDKCNVVYFKSPNSFTGEDVCEIFIHGSPLIASQLEQTFKDFKILGLRLAKKGEFSFRSVLNSKNTLKQARAINSIINDDSFSSLDYNKNLLFKGDIKSGLYPLREEIINLFSEITASIDFVEDEDFNFHQIMKKTREFFTKCNKLLQNNRTKIEQKTICRIMLIGPVNVGKSTLFNKIIDKERAIVTKDKGTTRDVLSNHIIVDEKKFEIFDTAGQRTKQGKIERYGYQKAQKLSADVDHFLILKDKYTKNNDLKQLFEDFSIKKNYTQIETKSDKYNYNTKNIKINHNLDRDSLLKKINLLSIHKKYVLNKNRKINFDSSEMEFLHRILDYKRDILEEKDILIIAQLIRNILDDFSYEFGYINNEDVYDKVFTNFCIGK